MFPCGHVTRLTFFTEAGGEVLLAGDLPVPVISEASEHHEEREREEASNQGQLNLVALTIPYVITYCNRAIRCRFPN